MRDPGDASPGRNARQSGWTLGQVILLAAIVFIAWHVASALAARHNPPLACQLLGGRWDIWDGWRCR